MARLPHIYPKGATLFITFRLADSLPQNIVKELKLELVDRKALILRTVDDEVDRAKKISKLQKELFGKYEHQLDEKPFSECHLDRVEVAKSLYNKLREYDGRFYNLICFCIMPNHVHILVDTSIQLANSSDQIVHDYVPVNQWMQLVKGGSSFKINKILNRKGMLWEKESFDHWIRNERSLKKTINYIAENPVKAGLGSEKLSAPFMYMQLH